MVTALGPIEPEDAVSAIRSGDTVMVEGFGLVGSTAGLDACSDPCLWRVSRAEHFSWWMRHMLDRRRTTTRST